MASPGYAAGPCSVSIQRTDIRCATWVQCADSRLGIRPQEITLAELLKSHGYVTTCIGKWHLGLHPQFLPGQQGFDHYCGLLYNLDPIEVVCFEQTGEVIWEMLKEKVCHE